MSGRPITGRAEPALDDPPDWLEEGQQFGHLSAVPRARAETHDDLTFIETVPAFFARVQDVVEPMLIEGLLPGDGVAMNHGAPRALKTWGMLEQFISLGTGTPAFGFCEVSSSVPAAYLTNEDGGHRVKQRIAGLLAARGIEHPPDHLHLAVHRSVWLDDPSWQDRLIRAAQKYGYRAIFFDPLRSLTGAVDQGPRELQPFATFLRLLVREARCVVCVGHHDTKPPAQGRDERKRPQRASGGGLFSHVDAPVHFERLTESPATALLTPAGWKHTESPAAIEVSLTIGDDIARLVGRRTTAEEAESLALHEEVTAFVRRHQDATGNQVVKGIRKGRQMVYRALEQLAEQGALDSRTGKGRTVHWFVRGCSESSGVVPEQPESESSDGSE